jgi:hypothetical protein
MADKYRHRLEFDRKRRFAVATTQAIEMGDLCYWDGTSLRPASVITYVSLLQAQQDFVKDFVGMAAQASPVQADGHLSPILVDTDGVKEYPCASATWAYGDLVGVDDNAAPDALLPQQVIAVTDPRAAIGRCMRTEASAVTSVMVELFPPKAQSPAVATPDDFFRKAHTVTAVEDTAGQVDIDTGFGAAPTHVELTILTVTSGALKTALAVTFPGTGVVRIADNGGETVTEDDTIYLSAYK